MNWKIFYLKLLLGLLMCNGMLQLNGQQNNIDTILNTIERSKSSEGIDTVVFIEVMRMIEKSNLNDTSINQLEKIANNLIDNDGAYWGYGIKLSILNNYIGTDKSKALAYGKFQIDFLENSKTPKAFYYRSAFFKALRLPYRNSNMLAEGFTYFNSKLKEYKIKNDSIGIADSYYVLSGFYRTIGLLDQSIYNMKKSVSYMPDDDNIEVGNGIFINPVGKLNKMNNISVIGMYHMQKGDYEEGINYARSFYLEYNKSKLDRPLHASTLLAEAQLMSGQLDSVMYYLNITLSNEANQDQPDFIAFALQIKALYKIETGALEEAETILKQCWQLINENNLPSAARPGTLSPDYYIALLNVKKDRINEAITAILKDIEWVKGQRLFEMRGYKLLATLYEKIGAYKNANEANKTFISLQDTLNADQSNFSSLSFELEQEMNEKEYEISKLENKNKIADVSRNFTIGIAILLSILAGVIYYRFQSKKKANLVLEKTLTALKSTQAQLIQSEKMASLGELTAGIAHEIQNPLNFINNFSEVNTEMIDEIEEEIDKGNMHEVKALVKDIKENEERINHHGKRADAIVKGMLLHSRRGSGQKELTDINALCDEYLRLAYHGMKAKDKGFEASFNFEPDNTLPTMNIVPQDMGRVLLNLINNAFQACGNNEFRMMNDEFKPHVIVSTRNSGGNVEISVKDNGPGIPDAIKNKIFQPFFTTKPTGQGTGLGLSLSYDIVKAHGGELKVETEVGKGTTFIVQIPNVIFQE